MCTLPFSLCLLCNSLPSNILLQDCQVSSLHLVSNNIITSTSPFSYFEGSSHGLPKCASQLHAPKFPSHTHSSPMPSCPPSRQTEPVRQYSLWPLHRRTPAIPHLPPERLTIPGGPSPHVAHWRNNLCSLQGLLLLPGPVYAPPRDFS